MVLGLSPSVCDLFEKTNMVIHFDVEVHILNIQRSRNRDGSFSEVKKGSFSRVDSFSGVENGAFSGVENGSFRVVENGSFSGVETVLLVELK